MKLDLVEVEGGTRLRLRVKAGARRTAIVGEHGGALKLGVSAPPEKGRANRAVLALLADALGLAPSELELVSGTTSPDKVVLVPLAANELADRLESSGS